MDFIILENNIINPENISYIKIQCSRLCIITMNGGEKISCYNTKDLISKLSSVGISIVSNETNKICL